MRFVRLNCADIAPAFHRKIARCSANCFTAGGTIAGWHPLLTSGVFAPCHAEFRNTPSKPQKAEARVTSREYPRRRRGLEAAKHLFIARLCNGLAPENRCRRVWLQRLHFHDDEGRSRHEPERSGRGNKCGGA